MATKTINVNALNEVADSKTIHETVGILKSYGIKTPREIDNMAKVSAQGTKGFLFWAAFAVLLVIGFLSFIGSSFIMQLGPVASLVLTGAAIGGLWACYGNKLRGGILYSLLVLDLLLAFANATIFVPGAFGQEETIARQVQYMDEDNAMGNTYLATVASLANSEVEAQRDAVRIATMEALTKEGPVWRVADAIRHGLDSVINDSIPTQAFVSEDIRDRKPHSLDQIRKMGEEAHVQLVKQVSPYLNKANHIREKAQKLVQPVTDLVHETGLSPNQITNAKLMRSKIYALAGVVDSSKLQTDSTGKVIGGAANSSTVFGYDYQPKLIKTVVMQPKWIWLSLGLDAIALLFWILLISVKRKEEQGIDMLDATDAAQDAIVAKIVADWGIQVGVKIPTDDTLAVILQWLEDHADIRTSMIHNSMTLSDFIDLYTKYGDDILELVDDGTSKFQLHELHHLATASPNDYQVIIEKMTCRQWQLMQQWVDDTSLFMDIADLSVIFDIWKSAPVDGQLVVDDNMEAAFDFLEDYYSDKLRQTIKDQGISLKQFVALYQSYTQDQINASLEDDANFTLDNLRDALPAVISNEILAGVKAANTTLLGKYNISLVKFAALPDSVKNGLVRVIETLEQKINDAGNATLYIMPMIKDLSIFTAENVAVWNALVSNLKRPAAMTKVTIDLLNKLTVAAVEDFCGIINQLTEGAEIIMNGWEKQYSEIIVDWKNEGIYDLNLQALLKRTARVGNLGFLTFFSAYETVAKQLAEMRRKDIEEADKKKVKPVVAAPVALEPVASTPVETEPVLKFEEDEVKAAPVPVVAVEPAAVEEAPVEEPLPVRKLEVTLTLANFEKAKDNDAKIALLAKAFKIAA